MAAVTTAVRMPKLAKTHFDEKHTGTPATTVLYGIATVPLIYVYPSTTPQALKQVLIGTPDLSSQDRPSVGSPIVVPSSGHGCNEAPQSKPAAPMPKAIEVVSVWPPTQL